MTKTKLEEYTESEFLEFLNIFFTSEEPEESTEDDDKALDALDAHEAYVDSLVEHFEMITEHPSGSDLIFYPEKGEGSPEAIIENVKKWRAANGKSGFKPA
ncbi:bacteriocin immunity protein [Pseudomonas sp.]|uniref:bacteriocin immunity protein n=1 Tax=Pseudomonas sp. TaxID=306 RepID=UPI0028AF9887|nr:bacteriocin immunity protein [Pseudomonas sp.]